MTVRRTDRGSASLEMAMIVPALLLLIFGTIQLVTYLHARNTAQAASAACAESARTLGADLDRGRQSAANLLQATDSLIDPTVEATSSSTEVRCTVRGTVNRLVPVGPSTIEMTAVMPRERVT